MLGKIKIPIKSCSEVGLVDTPGVGYSFWGVQVDPGGVELRPVRSEEVQGSLEPQNGGLRAGRGLDDDFLLETFFCQVWSFPELQGPVQVAPGGVEQRPRRSQEVEGSSRPSVRRKGC